MRLADWSDYRRLRSMAENPWEIVRFRKRRGPGRVLEVRLRDGRRFRLRGDRQDFHVFHRIFLRDEYRLDGVPPRAWDTVVDLGGNVGLFALRAVPLARRVICYEPAAENLPCLEENLRGTRALVVPEAVDRRSGRVPLYRPVSRGQSGRFSLHPRVGGLDAEPHAVVAATSLDELFARHEIDRCDLLKLDVEGAEYGILRGAAVETLAVVREIRGEYHDVEPRHPEDRVEVLVEGLRGHGFSVEVTPHRRKPNRGLFFARRS